MNFDIFKVQKPGLKPAKGRILIAEPFLQGPYFNRSIVFLTEYSEEGAVGFVLNKSSELYPDEVIEDLFNFKGELYVGGPVSSNTLYFIHTLGDQIQGAVKITDTLYWGGDFDVVKDMINTGVADYTQVKFFAGYSGWSPGQLEGEIKENSWIVAEAKDAMVMDDNIDHIWKQAMEDLGDVFKAWTNFPENPTYN
ncbi:MULTISPECIES: YqgE/AlgH family protein [unclassified Carboxylicivirga]|uniref:YqgE/AlgH family protein n=1 Tax=Carboxylicivirga TaxID=1628153 RepID=UPI003D356691